MADNSHSQAPSTGAQTTGHVWDGDLQEFNNPLPVWWTYTFLRDHRVRPGLLGGLSVLADWQGLPAGHQYVTYVNADGQEEAWHWNTRAKLLAETQEAVIAQKPYFDKIASLPYEKVAKDPELSSFVVSAGKALFSDNCAACHQSGGQGKIGFFPNLTDDDWMYGGSSRRSTKRSPGPAWLHASLR
jgi:cytochrome c oxidase cbb3-type subunit 3